SDGPAAACLRPGLRLRWRCRGAGAGAAPRAFASRPNRPRHPKPEDTSMSEKEILAELSADNVRAHVEHICTSIPSRLAGSEKQRIAGILGAAGCVMMNWGHDTNASVPWGSVKPVWGNPTPDNYGTEMPVLPCVGIARTEGLKLREMAKRGPVRVWFRTKVENGWRPIWITTGEIPAATSQDFVVLGGHQDSWYGPAATDNAAGNP